MNAGFDNFKSLYNQDVSDPVAWDINQLKGEQQALQPVHEKYLGERTSFTGLSEFMTNTEVNPLFNDTDLSIDTKQGMPGGVDILDYKSRVEFGCKLMDYSASQGCQP